MTTNLIYLATPYGIRVLRVLMIIPGVIRRMLTLKRQMVLLIDRTTDAPSFIPELLTQRTILRPSVRSDTLDNSPPLFK
jgi:hypothetical protein